MVWFIPNTQSLITSCIFIGRNYVSLCDVHFLKILYKWVATNNSTCRGMNFTQRNFIWMNECHEYWSGYPTAWGVLCKMFYNVIIIIKYSELYAYTGCRLSHSSHCHSGDWGAAGMKVSIPASRLGIPPTRLPSFAPMPFSWTHPSRHAQVSPHLTSFLSLSRSTLSDSYADTGQEFRNFVNTGCSWLRHNRTKQIVWRFEVRVYLSTEIPSRSDDARKES